MATEVTAKEILTQNDTDRAIALTGSGRFHTRITFVCGGCFMAVAFQSGINSIVLPASQCDFQMNSEQMGTLNVAFMLGTIASSVLWGALADLWGRKKVILLALLVDAAVTVISSFSQTYTVFVIFRFVNGFTTGGPSSLVIPYLGEFFTKKQGTTISCYVGFFWTLGWMLLPGIAWLIIPMDWNININGYIYNSWRIFVCTFSIPSILAAAVLWFYPESPRYLLSRGKLGEAMLVLREMFSNNMRKPPEEYPVVLANLPPGNSAAEYSENITYSMKPDVEDLKPIESLPNVLWKQIVTLFTPPVLKNVSLCSALLFTNMFGYFGLGLWLPELFNRFESFYQLHPNESSISVCELNTFLARSGENETSVEVSSGACNSSTIDPTVFMNTLTVGVVCLLGNVLSGLLATSFRRWVMPVATMTIAGVSGMSIYFVNNSTGVLIVTCIFQAAISSANFVISGNIVELFPTTIRAMAISVALLAGRLGSITSNLILGKLIDVNCDVPILLIGGVVLFGGFLAFFTPSENGKRSLKEGAA